MSAFRFLIPMLTISYQMEFKNNYTNEEETEQKTKNKNKKKTKKNRRPNETCLSINADFNETATLILLGRFYIDITRYVYYSIHIYIYR